MNKKNFQIIMYLLVLGVIFLLPFLIQDTGSAMFVLLLLMPILLLVLSAIYSAVMGFQWYFSLLVGLLFIPTIFIHYNESAWIYAPAFALVSFIGQGIGMLFRKLSK
ncbi:MAG: hypothetical protein Q4A29_07710 [Eubacteriales bacterium]|nr:hypothetical protein [Eubacteriales bacterium]